MGIASYGGEVLCTYLFVNADLHRLRQGDSDRPQHRLKNGFKSAGLVDFLVAIGRRGSIGRLGMMGVQADCLLVANLSPMRLNQLGLCGHGVEGVGVGAHLIVDYIVPLNAHRPDHVLALLLCPQLKGLAPFLLVTFGLKSGHTDLSWFFNVVNSTFLSI